MAETFPVPSFEAASFTKTWHHTPYAGISPTRPELSVAGKNIVVTGGGTGIGKAIAIAFAQAGARSIAILGRHEEKLHTATAEIRSASTGSTQVLYKVADITKAPSIRSSLAEIVQGVGSISIFVANAGMLPQPCDVGTADVDSWVSGFSGNVVGPLNSIQAFLPLASQNAVLINIVTVIAHMAPLPGMGAYAASKAANAKMVDYVAAENPGLHIVNVHPGVVATQINEGFAVRDQDGEYCDNYFP